MTIPRKHRCSTTFSLLSRWPFHGKKRDAPRLSLDFAATPCSRLRMQQGRTSPGAIFWRTSPVVGLAVSVVALGLAPWLRRLALKLKPWIRLGRALGLPQWLSRMSPRLMPWLRLLALRLATMARCRLAPWLTLRWLRRQFLSHDSTNLKKATKGGAELA
jgi:hypothetical protein